MITVETAKKMGEEHAEKRLKLTPYDCQYFDKQLFAQLDGMTNSLKCKNYLELRGAFNDSWNRKNFELS